MVSKKRKDSITFIVAFILLIGVLIFGILRLTAFGQFIDFLFIFMFGNARHIFYALIIYQFLFFNILKKKRKTKITWQRVLGLVLSTFFILGMITNIFWFFWNFSNSSTYPLYSKNITSKSIDIFIGEIYPSWFPKTSVQAFFHSNFAGGFLGAASFGILANLSSIFSFIALALLATVSISLLYFHSFFFIFKRKKPKKTKINNEQKTLKKIRAEDGEKYDQKIRLSLKNREEPKKEYISILKDNIVVDSSPPEKKNSLLNKKTHEEVNALLYDEEDKLNIVDMDNKKQDYKDYVFPSTSILKDFSGLSNSTEWEEKANYLGEKLINTLAFYDIAATIANIIIGPRVFKYEITVPEGKRLSEITKLEDEIKISLAAKTVRIEAPIPGTNYVGFEIPNESFTPIGLKDLFFGIKKSDPILSWMIGKNSKNENILLDIAKSPHILVAGTTGSGKSVFISSLICTLLLRNKPSDVKLVLIDPKRVEFQFYEKIPHLLTPVIYKSDEAILALEQLVEVMNNRYELLAASQTKNIEAYNSKHKNPLIKMPYIILIIDELADLMAQSKKEAESYIMQLCQKSRACGIHLVLATQRPSVDVITGVIKSNIPTRISFKLTSYVDSKTILDESGSEKLLGKGDFLYKNPHDSVTIRGQGCFISDDEINSIINQIPSKNKPNFTNFDLFKGKKKEQ
jgi:DNA segregation ATPase FtsK/SpoIIIE, S-DNA-T family